MANFSICGLVGANTGAIDCDVTRGNPTQIIAGSASFAAADYADSDTLKAAFLTKIKQAKTASDKLFPFPVIQGVSDKTEAAKYGSLGYGLQVKLLRSKPGYEFDVLAGSSLEKQLVKFDGKVVPLFIFDDQSNIWGILDENDNFQGAEYLVGVEPRGFGDAQNPKTTKISISVVDSKDFTENSKFASVSFSTNDLQGLVDVELYETAAHASNVWKIGARIATDDLISTIDVHDSYATELASSSLWEAFTGATYATSLALTSVANDTTNGGWTVTFDSTAYGLLSSGDKIKLRLKDPATLDAADVTGIESGFIILTK